MGSDGAGSLTPGQAFVGIVQRELTRLIGGPTAPLDLAVVPPAVILLAGLQGSGKTTSAGKLARLLRQDMRKKVLLVSCDVYRPAAIAQPETLAGQVGVDFPSSTDQDPVAIAPAAVDWGAGTITRSSSPIPPTSGHRRRDDARSPRCTPR
jgi:signal recognition particle subunit SRP54